MSFRQTETASVAAAKAGFSAATAYRIEQDLRLPSQKRSPRGRQPLAAVWDSEAVPLLKSVPGLRPVAIFDEIRRRYPEEWLEQLVLNFGRNADAVIADADFNRAPEISRRHPLARRSIASLRRIANIIHRLCHPRRHVCRQPRRCPDNRYRGRAHRIE
jgi:hypothetical protein